MTDEQQMRLSILGIVLDATGDLQGDGSSLLRFAHAGWLWVEEGADPDGADDEAEI